MQHDCLYKMDFDPSGHTPWPCPPPPPGSHRNSNCVPPVLIYRAIICDSFKALAKKKPEELADNKKKTGPNSLFFLTSSDPQPCPRGKRFAPLYSALHNLRFDMQHDYVYTKWISDPSKPHLPDPVPRGTSKFRMCFFSPHS